MNRIAKRAVLISLFIFAGATSAWAFDFSADVVNKAEGQTFTGKIYVSGDKMRMEMGPGTTITRIDKKVAWIIMPGQNMYMEQPLNVEQTMAATEKVPGEIERTFIGPDTLDGKTVKKYRIRYASDGRETVALQWMDPAINIPVKTAAEDGSWSMEYKNISLAAQPGSLFEVPAGCQKLAIPSVDEMMRAAQ